MTILFVNLYKREIQDKKQKKILVRSCLQFRVLIIEMNSHKKLGSCMYDEGSKFNWIKPMIAFEVSTLRK